MTDQAAGYDDVRNPQPAPDWERIAREAVLHVIRHREDFHNASQRPCGTCDRSAAFLATLPDDVKRGYVDTSCTSTNGRSR